MNIQLPSRVSPRWEIPQTVANFRENPPNEVLMEYVLQLCASKSTPLRVLDIGGGAGRNAIPLARLGCEVVCTDLSWPMLIAADEKRRAQSVSDKVLLAQCAMASLPFQHAQFDLLVAHGIWNLARSQNEFRAAVAEAARVAEIGARLFLFTFSRHTIPGDGAPVAGEEFVFTQFNGEPQCFLTEEEIVAELSSCGFVREGNEPLREYNRPVVPRLSAEGPPVLYEGTFIKRNLT
jgi:ubiquinone/menaquinone biosynthesis C-methylase UbiE